MRRREFLKASGLALVGACAGSWRPSLAAPKPMPDVVVLLPGITGSVLRKDNRDLWALTPSGVIDALRTLGTNLKALELRDDPPDVDDLGDGVTADRLFPDVHLIPGLWKIDGYTRVARRIANEFDVKPGHNYFEFPYDWRRDNRVAARRLARSSHDWLKKWRAESGKADAKLVLIAHSMGGLVSRHFLECLDGWRDTRMLITFGTPYRGSPNALSFLSNGFVKRGIEFPGLTDLLRSFTSVYQLLPRYPCYDPGDGTLRRIGETTGVPGVDPDRAARALDFHFEIDRAVEAHLENEAYRTQRYAIHPIIGTYQRTLQSAKRVEGRVEMSTTYPGRDLDGDGTVPRPSATPLELDGKGMFVAEQHGVLQNADAVLVQVAGLLSGADDYGLREFPLAEAVSIDLDDAFLVGEPIRLRYRCEDDTAALTATVVDVRTGRPVAHQPLRQRDDGEFQEAELAPLATGTYRITVGAPAGVASVSDLFIVCGEAPGSPG